MIEPPFYAKPTADGSLLRKLPQLASWDVGHSPSQTRLRDYLDDTVALIGDLSVRGESQLALRLDVGLSASVALLGDRDLDNYLFPVAARLSPFRDRRFVSFWATKRHADTSIIRVEPAVLVAAPLPAALLVKTAASSVTTAYKKEIHSQLSWFEPLPDGPVHLELSFTIGPGRNWLNLWKPTIDALDPILGRTRAGRDWHPEDGRIVELGLHCAVDSSLGHAVRIAVHAAPSPSD